LNKKTFAWILVVIFLVLLGITLLALLGARRSSGTEGTAPTTVPTAIAMPTSTSIPLAPTATSKPAPTAVPTTPPSNDAAIQNIVWQWTQLTDQGTVTAVPNPASYTLVFRSDGTFTGTADCNQISGTYSTGNGFSINVKTPTNPIVGKVLWTRYISRRSTMWSRGVLTAQEVLPWKLPAAPNVCNSGMAGLRLNMCAR